MPNYKIGCDAHKRFSQFAVRDATGRLCLHRIQRLATHATRQC